MKQGSNLIVSKFIYFPDNGSTAKPPVGDFFLRGKETHSNCIEIASGLQMQNFKYKIPQY